MFGLWRCFPRVLGSMLVGLLWSSPGSAAESVHSKAGVRVSWSGTVQQSAILVRGELRNDRGEHLGDLEVSACLPDGQGGCRAQARTLLSGLVKVGETASFALTLPRPAGQLPASLRLEVGYRLVDEDGGGAPASFTVSGPLSAP